MKRKVMAALLAAGLAWAPSAVLPVSAAEAWTLPSAGIRMDMQTRQTYMQTRQTYMN